MAILFNAPAVATIDQNNVFTLSWTPAADAITGSYAAYNHWDIVYTVNAGPNQIVRFLAPMSYAGGSLTYSQSISAGLITLSMQAFSSADDSVAILPPWKTGATTIARPFPTAISASTLTFSALSVLLGQALTVTLANTYTNADADQWQVNWPDGTSTGWLPVSSTTNLVTKSFSTLGGQSVNVVILTRKNYSGSSFAPPATLQRQFTQQIFIINQQAATTPTTQSGLTGDLGIGGQQGFEITQASGTTIPNPWEVIARGLVRDPLTNELKLLVATSRFSNASSLFGTMALDVFPIEGRPRAKDFVVPPYELTVTNATESVPVSIATTALPTLFVGKSVTQSIGNTFPLAGQNGITPYIWSSVGLPAGLTINASGILDGTPLELGVFSVTVAVQDSSVPFSIAEATLSLTIETDLKVIIAPNQVDANNTTLAQTGTTLGVAQVGTPYNVMVQVGNININASIPGGLPPYTWSAPAGAFPTGLSIITDPANSLFGLISGTPSTYNSTTDFNTTYSVTLQVTDAIGAKATQTYTMTLEPAALQFGHLNQTTLYTFEEFKLVVPVFGGQSPYTFNPSFDFLVGPADVGLYGTPQLVDGQIEIPVTGVGGAGIPSTGSHTFSLQVTDNLGHTPSTQPTQFSYTVETEISDIRVTPGVIVNATHATDGSWGVFDTTHATPMPVSGNLAGFAVGQANILQPTQVGLPYYEGGYRLDTSQATALVGSTVYTVPTNSDFAAWVGLNFFVSGFVASNGTNNGPFRCTASTATSITLNNAAGVTETHAGIILLATVLANGISVLIDPTLTPPQVQWFGPPGPDTSTIPGSQAIFKNANYRVQIPIAAQFVLTAAATAVGGATAYTGTITGGAANAYTGQTFYIAGFTNAGNNGTFVCTLSTATILTLTNAGGTVETHAAVADLVSTPLDIFSREYTALSHDDPTTLTLTSVASSIGTTAVYTGTIIGGASNAFAGFFFTVTGFVANPLVNNGYFVCTASSATTLTLANAAAIVETHAASAIGDIGTITTYARPYIVGDVVGLNPRKPYYNSSDIPAFNGINAWTARVAGGSALPPGLSLDANTALVYGTLTGTGVPSSVIQYVDAVGTTHGTVTISWITYQSNFQLTDQVVDSQPVGTPYNGATAFVAPPGITLSTVSLANAGPDPGNGRLPAGLSVSTDGTNLIISGTPTEAGYFDCWFQAQSTNNQNSYIYHRISTIIPVQTLVIAGWAPAPYTIGQPIFSFPLPNALLTPASYGPIQIVALNGDPPYTWGSTPGFPFNGIAFATTGASAGQLSGSATSVFSQLFDFTVTDSLSNTYTVTNVLLSSQPSTLLITTASLPGITSGLAYTTPLAATGGTPPYTWSLSPLNTNALPTGIGLSSAGVLSGTTTQGGYNKSVVFRVTDSVASYSDKTLTVQVSAGLSLISGIDFEDTLATFFLGTVDSGNVMTINTRPNLSFYVTAKNVVSSSIAGVTAGTNNGSITATVKSLTGTPGTAIAQIELDGSGFNIAVGTHSVTVTVTDSGVTVSQAFTWTVYDNGTMVVGATNAYPTRLTTPT